MRKNFTYFNLSKPYVQQCPLIVQAACILADVKTYWRNAEEACFRSLCSCYVAEACLNGCPFSLAHTTFATLASDQLEAWASIALCGFLNSSLGLQLYTGGLTSKGVVIFFSSPFSSFPLSSYWRFSAFFVDWGLNFEQSHLKNMGWAHKMFSS